MVAPVTKEQPHALYRFWNAEGHLLYVGLTVDPGARWKAHGREKSWWTEVVTVTLEWFPDRDSVEIAEIKAIREEKPRYNVVHNQPVAEEPQVELTVVGWHDWDESEMTPEWRKSIARLTRDEWLRTGEVAMLLGVSIGTIQRGIRNGDIGYRLKPGGSQRLCSPEDVRRLLTKSRQVVGRAAVSETDG